jgi:hypothetical protein
MRKLLIAGIFISLFLGIVNVLYAQTDTEFWFVAPEISQDHGDSPVLFRITTGDMPSDISITMPANTTNFPELNYSIEANSTLTIDFTALGLQDEIESYYDFLDGVSGKSNKGILIQSTNPITVYYEVARMVNTDIFTLKGENALGTEFYGIFQTKAYNMSRSNWLTCLPTQHSTSLRQKTILLFHLNRHKIKSFLGLELGHSK